MAYELSPEQKAKRAAYAREWRSRQTQEWRDKKNADNREWRRQNPELQKTYAKRSSAARAARLGSLLAEQRREYDKKKNLSRYGLSTDDYNAMYESQGGRCAICTDYHVRLHVDHDHVTGKVRALLCTRCNPGLGYFRESSSLLSAAIEYLRKHAD